MGAILAAVRGLGSRHPELWIVLAVAVATRLAFALRPPPFLTPDSQGYYLPGWELAHGLGFGPELRRTPGYPLFVALVVFLIGEDLRGLVLAQHALGVVTAGLARGIGLLAFGRLAGLVAGLATALAGPLLIYEHYVLTESLFACLLALALYLMLRALRRPTRGRLFAAGFALAAAALTRPVADILLPLLPLALLLGGLGVSRFASARAVEPPCPPIAGGSDEPPAIGGQGGSTERSGADQDQPDRADRSRGSSRRRSIVRDRFLPAAHASGWFALGLAALMLPWMGRNALAHGTFSAEGALGQALIGRTVRHDDFERFYRCPPAGDPGDPKVGALRIICEEVAAAAAKSEDEKPSGGTITQRVREELGLSQAETSNVLRRVAFDAILGQPGYYVTGSLRKAGEILVGKRETVLAPWRERTTRNWDNKWDPRLTPLVKDPPPAEGPEYERADAVVSFFQPWRHRRELGLLLMLGLLAALARPAWRVALLPAAAAAAIVLTSAALDGNVWRYRYPVDPLLAVLVGGGVQALWASAVWVARRRAATAGRSRGRRGAAGDDRDDPAERHPRLASGRVS